MINSSSKVYDKVYRNELKFYVDYNDYRRLTYELSSVLKLDNNAGSSGEYWIRSLYFDDINNNDYYNKMMGSKDRKKIRLRIYDVSQGNVKLEIKNKYSEYMLKEGVILDREDAKQLINGNKDVLLKYDNKTANKVYYYMSKNYYHPKVIVDYKREAYVSDVQNLRITFDKDIRSCVTNFDIFDENLNTLPIFDEKKIVMEVKFNKFLPSVIKKMIASVKSDKSAISKYCMSRNIF